MKDIAAFFYCQEANFFPAPIDKERKKWFESFHIEVGNKTTELQNIRFSIAIKTSGSYNLILAINPVIAIMDPGEKAHV